jgi:ATP-binding cassette subfamily C protein LapB
MTDTASFWQQNTPAIIFDDPLLQCLVTLTQIYNNPLSAEALRAGLPLVEHRLTPELFIRAAQRAHLSARLIKQPLTRFSELLLPAVLLLKDGQACLLLKYTDKKKRTVQIILPNSEQGTMTLSRKALESNYSGYALIARPVYTFDARVTQENVPRTRYWFWGTVLKSWPLYSEVLIASLLVNLFALASPLFIMNVYDRVVPNHAIETLWVLAIGVTIVFSFDFIIRGLRGYFIDIAGKKSDVILASLIFEQVLATQRVAHPRSVGAFANHLHEFETFREFFTSATLTTLIDLPFAFLFIAVIWSLQPDLALIPLLAMPLVLIFSLLMQFPLRRVIKHTFRASAQKQAILVETLNGLEDIKALGAEGLLQRRWENIVGQIAQSSLKSRFLSALSVNFSLLVQQLTTVAVVVYGVYLIADNALSMGGLIACTILTGRALAPLAQIAALLTRYHQSLAALHSLNHIMEMPLERPPGHRFLHRPQLQGHIEFKQVNFSYPEQALPTLTQMSCQIQAGERVGIIGRIGSGKSTLAKLLLGLYQPQQGSILLDGVDSRQIDPVDLRRHIGYVPQDGTLFYGTVKENIVIAAPYVEDSAVLKVAQLAGVNEFTDRHPLGFDRPVGERGDGLSGGQRQAILLARALLLNPPIILLDEPTNAMDNSTEEQLKTRLSPYLADKTLLLVTHRTSLLSLVERLIVLEGGQVVASGPKAQVIQALASGHVKAASP